MKSNRYILELDGLRAVAVAAVILHHSFTRHIKGGGLGVDLFFVLSGYLITSLLVAEFYNTKGIRLGFFYLRRACRLLPSVALVLLLTAFIWWIQPPTGRIWVWWKCASAVAFYYANFFYGNLDCLAPAWSLSVEEQFYFFWPLTLLFLLKSKSPSMIRHATLFLIFLCIGIRALLVWNSFSAFPIYTFTPCRGDQLLIGALVALYAGHPNAKRVVAMLCRYKLPEIVFVYFLLACVLYSGWDTKWYFYIGPTLNALLFAVLIGCVSYGIKGTVLMKCLGNQAMRWTGKRAYGLYLYHMPLFHFVDVLGLTRGLNNIAATFLVKLPLTFIFAALSYAYIESPFLRKRNSFRANEQYPESTSAVQGNLSVG
jgi:peptidoglycan/LPS O-acetylase OafA/YrhL